MQRDHPSRTSSREDNKSTQKIAEQKEMNRSSLIKTDSEITSPRLTIRKKCALCVMDRLGRYFLERKEEAACRQLYPFEVLWKECGGGFYRTRFRRGSVGLREFERRVGEVVRGEMVLGRIEKDEVGSDINSVKTYRRYIYFLRYILPRKGWNCKTAFIGRGLVIL